MTRKNRRQFLASFGIAGLGLAGVALSEKSIMAMAGKSEMPALPNNLQNPHAINIKKFGAIGDGKKDDTGAFAKAINTGMEIIVPPGEYIIDSIELEAGAVCILRGAGQGITRLKHKNNAANSMFFRNTLRDSRVMVRFELHNITLDGNEKYQEDRSLSISGIEIGADHIFISNCEIKGTINAAIRILACTFHAYIVNNWLHDFSLHSGGAANPTDNNDSAAINIKKEIVSDGVIWIVDNRVEMTSPPSGPGNSVQGICCSSRLPQRMIIRGNTLINMGQDIAKNIISPIQIYRNGDGSIIAENRIINSYWGGIKVQRSNNVQIVNNLIEGEGEVGTDTPSSAIIVSTRKPVIQTRGMIIAGNQICGVPSMGGISAFWEPGGELTDISVCDNMIDGALFGIHIEDVRGSVKIRGNNIRNLTGTSSKHKGIRIRDFSSSDPVHIDVSHNSLENTNHQTIMVGDDEPREVYANIANNYFSAVGLTGEVGVSIRNVAGLFFSGNVMVKAPKSPIAMENIRHLSLLNNWTDNNNKNANKLSHILTLISNFNSWDISQE